jgi:uncharacterized protein (DUF58 family)
VGIIFTALCAVSLAAGFLLKEAALLVFGALFLALLAYCFGACLAARCAYRIRALGLGADFAPSVTAAGEPVAVSLGNAGGAFRQPSAILVRYQIILKTLDGRVIEKAFPRKFFAEKSDTITGKERGAYFGACDYLLIADIFGFFSMRVRIPSRQNARLLVYPRIRRRQKSVSMNTGGSEQAAREAFVSNDDLIEQRQYVPGDDPRRINWKLYGHSGELFVREGEKTGKPLPEINFFIDTQTKKRDKAQAADELCERAMGLAVHAAPQASSVAVYYRGCEGPGGKWAAGMDKSALYALFALPFAAGAGAAEPVLPEKVLVINDA